jgi:hypothetical protein
MRGARRSRGTDASRQRRVVELESGEKNPQIETLVKIAAKTGLEFAIDIAPIGQEPKLIGSRRPRHPIG